MTQASAKMHCHAFQISDLTPDDVIELGYNLFLSSHAPEAVLKSRAESVVQEFDSFVGEVRPELDQSERLYVMQIQMAANDLARGIARRKDDRNRSLQAAQDKYQEMPSCCHLKHRDECGQ